MNVKLKRCCSLFCFILLCYLSGNVAFAAASESTATTQSPENAVVQWVNTTSVEVDFSINGSKAACGACVIGKVNTTEITGTVVLERKNSDGTYTTVKTWSDLEASGDMLFFDQTYYVTTGQTYRLTVTATVYCNNSGETVTGYYEASAS